MNRFDEVYFDEALFDATIYARTLTDSGTGVDTLILSKITQLGKARFVSSYGAVVDRFKED